MSLFIPLYLHVRVNWSVSELLNGFLTIADQGVTLLSYYLSLPALEASSLTHGIIHCITIRDNSGVPLSWQTTTVMYTPLARSLPQCLDVPPTQNPSLTSYPRRTTPPISSALLISSMPHPPRCPPQQSTFSSPKSHKSSSPRTAPSCNPTSSSNRPCPHNTPS